MRNAPKNWPRIFCSIIRLLKGLKYWSRSLGAPIGKPLDYVAAEITRCWHKAYISLGSNMGDKEKNFKDALRMIDDGVTRVMQISDFHITKPVGYTEQDDFINGAAE